MRIVNVKRELRIVVTETGNTEWLEMIVVHCDYKKLSLG